MILASSLLPINAWALETVLLELDQLNTKQWQVHGIKLALTSIKKDRSQLTLQVDKLILAKPFQQIQLIDLRCGVFFWRQNQISCQHGQARFKLAQKRSKPFRFSFQINHQQQLQIQFNAKDLPVQLLKVFAPPNIELSKGRIDVAIQANGTEQALENIQLKLKLNNLSAQSEDGLKASENLSLKLVVTAKNKRGKWYWRSQLQTKHGGFYIDPIFIDVNDNGLMIRASGTYSAERLFLNRLSYQHSKIMQLDMNTSVQLLPKLKLNKIQGDLAILDLKPTAENYLMPFIAATGFEGFSLAGKTKLDFKLEQSKLTALHIALDQLSIKDENKRFELDKGHGHIYWSNDNAYKQVSNLYWKQLAVKGLPFDPGQLKFFLKQKQVQVLNSTIALMGGEVLIQHFYIKGKDDGEPDVKLEGHIKQISLQKLAQALDWPLLSGNISGDIPSVIYRDKKLTVDGEIKIKLFDGEVRINNLASSGMFTDFAQFYSDIEIDNLDLDLLTQKFTFGNIQGRLSGFVRNLYLENWHPIGFHAWLGSPEDDDSKHRISQKAVENIASIGGGGAADVVSKGFLRFFDSFDYDKLGLGCYLHDGVCQLMGVSAAEQGYYIVKGGGLPRINVIGYNPRVDWPVFISRLSRVMKPKEMVVH